MKFEYKSIECDPLSPQDTQPTPAWRLACVVTRQVREVDKYGFLIFEGFGHTAVWEKSDDR